MRVDRSRPVNPGRYRERIYFRRKTEGDKNSYGVPVETWTTYQECQAEVKPLRGNEMAAAQQIWADARWKVACHHLDGVQRADQIVWGGLDGDSAPLSTARTFDILEAEDPAGNREELVIYCREWAV